VGAAQTPPLPKEKSVMSKCDLFIFAGEMSGDLHGETLLHALYAKQPNLKIIGVGGPKMRSAGMDVIMPTEEFEVMGFFDILSSLPKFANLFRKVKKKILTLSPKGVVFIDYPGFNLRMARALKRKRHSAKRMHYICPSVWAWGKGRIYQMERSLDRLLTILPFEPDLFAKEKLDVEYVGHPLIASILSYSYDHDWRSSYAIDPNSPLFSIFPGSRQKELERNLTLQLKAAQKLLQDHSDFILTVSCSHEKFRPFIEEVCRGKATIISPSHTYELMRDSHLAIATSGTVTLELALHSVPTVVTFAISRRDVFLARKIFRINLPHYSLPNIIGKKEIFPELFGPHFTEKNLKRKIEELLLSQLGRGQCIEECRQLQIILGRRNASEEAARAILETIM
jgi:lipid-A-disaccharide synthase